MNNAVYENIDDVVAFVKWLDDELGFLVSCFVLINVASYSSHNYNMRLLLYMRSRRFIYVNANKIYYSCAYIIS